MNAPQGGDLRAQRYDGVSEDALARALEVPSVIAYERVGSTMDVAHALAAEGAPPGTLVLADAQTQGRGRQGRAWHSAAGQGIWLTLVERPRDAAALDVLSLRLGLHAATALEPFADADVRVKWPNDLQVAGRKLAGILVDARWREGRPEWVAIGFGLNVRAPERLPEACGLRADAVRPAVLRALVPALRAAASREGPLTPTELAAYAARDALEGRRISAPVAGTVLGIDAAGALRVRDEAGGERLVWQGSVALVP